MCSAGVMGRRIVDVVEQEHQTLACSSSLGTAVLQGRCHGVDHICQRPFLWGDGEGLANVRYTYSSSMAVNVSFCSAPPFTCLLEWKLCGS